MNREAISNRASTSSTSSSLFLSLPAKRCSSENNNGAGSPGIAAAARERPGAALESRGYDVLVINLFCALPATRRAETSFLRRIGLPRHDLKNLPTAFGRVTLPRESSDGFSRWLGDLALIPLDLGNQFRIFGGKPDEDLKVQFPSKKKFCIMIKGE